jgi:3-hydroxyisobutyrate dehydrogenase-like beta-hydroxyacid dehydrogenase
MTTPAAPGLRVGYIGLGQMGASMVARLLDVGADVTVCDLRPEAVDEAVAAGATAANSPADIAAVCDVVSICVPAARHVDTVVSGPGGLHEASRSDLPVLVHSTIGPDSVRDIASAAATWGGRVHDACVAGGGDAARNGTLVVLAGGLATLDERVRELLDVYGSKVVDCGPVGSGAALKLGINVMTYAQFTAAATAFRIAGGAGADTASLVDAWRHIGQLGRLTESFIPLLGIPPEHITGAFRDGLAGTVDIATKDLELAGALIDADPTFAAFTDALRSAMPNVFGIGET